MPMDAQPVSAAAPPMALSGAKKLLAKAPKPPRRIWRREGSETS